MAGTLWAMRTALDKLAARLPGGPPGNRHLTAVLGAVLLVGILAEIATLMLGLQRTLPWHIALGLGLIPVVLLKLASTGWRMIRYYTGNPAYRAEGPPRPFLRGIAPIVVGATLALFGSGVGLIVAPSVQIFRQLHGMSFALFLILVGVHALAHLPKVRHYAFADWISGRRAQGHVLRRAAVSFAVVAGGAVVMVALQHTGAWIAALHHGFSG